ncbi:MAG: BPSS1187 family protein [Nannocystales bacterium]
MRSLVCPLLIVSACYVGVETDAQGVVSGLPEGSSTGRHTGGRATEAGGASGASGRVDEDPTESSGETGDPTVDDESDGSSSASIDGEGTGSESSSGGGQASMCPEGMLDVPLFALDPQETGVAISDGYVHLYAEPTGPARGELFVFLPGSNAPPGWYELILQLAAAGGYHVLGLAYRNEVNLSDACGGGGPEGCQYNARREVIYGANMSGLVSVTPPDSIHNRLVRALQYLEWDEYLQGEVPRWSSIAFAGHSQGGGHVGVLAQDHDVARAVLVSGTESADWTEQPMATPSDRLFGFVHVEDGNYGAMTNSWSNLGIPGPPTSVDSVDPPYASHQLTTALPSSNPHASPAADEDTPLGVDDLPVYLPVWCAALGL